jgi:Spy/CpxP family protein refolding chaperone
MLKETTMNRTLKIALGVVGVMALALAGGIALAQHGPEGFMKRRLTRHIDAALEAVNATEAQRNAVHAARDHVIATFEESAASRQADLQEALKLWQADRIDQVALTTLRARHQATAKKVGDAIVQAVSDAHDALTALQRQQLLAYAKAHRPPKMEGARPWMQHMVSERVDDLLDQINATAAQRDTTHAAVQNVFAALAGEDPGQHFETALALFGADKIDPGKVAALQAEHQARAQKMGDAVITAITKVHDALSPAQRAQVAEIVKQHHQHEHHGG